MAKVKQEVDAKLEQVKIKPINMRVIALNIVGTAPYVQNRFGQKAIMQLMASHQMGDAEKKKKKRNLEAKDFTALYEGAMHVSREGWHGMPAHSFRAAAVRACSVADQKMTLAKLSFFVVADGYDRIDGTPLIRITKGEPRMDIRPVRNSGPGSKVDLRARPMWDEGWEATLRIRFDADQFGASDVANLIERIGVQVGIGEGRAFVEKSQSAGMGWGHFMIQRDAARQTA